MVNRWFEERKDLFFRDLVYSFLEAKVFFDELHRHYRKHKTVTFERMEYWIGTETRKGPLWNLKDSCHLLFRDSDAKLTLSEYLFDWTVGSIFHEGIKLKEDAYQLESYQPRTEGIQTSDDKQDIREVLSEYVTIATVIEKAARNLGAGIKSMQELFARASEQFRELLASHTHSGLLMRCLLEESELVEKALGRNSLQKIIAALYPKRPEQAYLSAGKSCLRGGWFKEAQTYFSTALEIKPDHPEAQKCLREAEKKLSPGGAR
jgi:tetratricopeptide (TPR) repeat protein